ncbi:hypothetical protein [Sodalis sp. C49]|uniref:head-tail joining protein n=1 Tax=Sodalis sp. C49 TaxID=3228929 RepID=UPI003965A6D9
MSIDWDTHLLAPLQGVFGDSVNYRPTGGAAYDISGIFDRAYTQAVESLDGTAAINTTAPVLGVRDAEFLIPPKKGERIFIATVGGRAVNQLFVIGDIQPDSHGGSLLLLNRVQQ